jgi:hypothetical protein
VRNLNRCQFGIIAARQNICLPPVVSSINIISAGLLSLRGALLLRRASKLVRPVLCGSRAEPTEHTRACRAIYIEAQLTRPEIDQIMIAGPLADEQDAAEFEKTLYLVRRRIEKRVVAAQIQGQRIVLISPLCARQRNGCMPFFRRDEGSRRIILTS